jgi:hypothetical protein
MVQKHYSWYTLSYKSIMSIFTLKIERASVHLRSISASTQESPSLRKFLNECAQMEIKDSTEKTNIRIHKKCHLS